MEKKVQYKKRRLEDQNMLPVQPDSGSQTHGPSGVPSNFNVGPQPPVGHSHLQTKKLIAGPKGLNIGEGQYIEVSLFELLNDPPVSAVEEDDYDVIEVQLGIHRAANSSCVEITHKINYKKIDERSEIKPSCATNTKSNQHETVHESGMYDSTEQNVISEIKDENMIKLGIENIKEDHLSSTSSITSLDASGLLQIDSKEEEDVFQGVLQEKRNPVQYCDDDTPIHRLDWAALKTEIEKSNATAKKAICVTQKNIADMKNIMSIKKN